MLGEEFTVELQELLGLIVVKHDQLMLPVEWDATQLKYFLPSFAHHIL